MKITILINSISGGGAERVACNLANSLSRNGDDVTLLTFSSTKTIYQLDDCVNIECLLCETGHADSSIHYLCQLRKSLKKYINSNSVDRLVVFLPIATILALSCRSLIAAPIIVSERNNPGSYATKYRVLLKAFAPKADRYVFQTENAKRWYGKKVKLAHGVIIPNAINAAFLGQQPRGEKGEGIVAVGRLVSQKNYPLLLSAFAELQKKIPDISLTIYGDGPLREDLKALSKDLNIEEKITWGGYVDDISEKLSKTALYVISSNFEGMPNSLIEAMSVGIPCIATRFDGGAAEELICDGENGLLVPKNDVDALTNAMHRLLTDTELSEKIATEAMKIKEKLSPDLIYDKWSQTIHSADI